MSDAWTYASVAIRRHIEQDAKAQRLGITGVLVRSARWELYGRPTRVEICIAGVWRVVPVSSSGGGRRARTVRWKYCPAWLRPTLYPQLCETGVETPSLARS